MEKSSLKSKIITKAEQIIIFRYIGIHGYNISA